MRPCDDDDDDDMQIDKCDNAGSEARLAFPARDAPTCRVRGNDTRRRGLKISARKEPEAESTGREGGL